MFCNNCIKRISACIEKKYGIKSFLDNLKDVEKISSSDMLLLSCFIKVGTAEYVKIDGKQYVQYKCSDKSLNGIKNYLLKQNLICLSWLDIYSYAARRIDSVDFDVEPSSNVAYLLCVRNMSDYQGYFCVSDLCSSHIRNLVFDDFAHCLEECFAMWVVKRNEEWSSFDFDECRLSDEIKKYFSSYSFGNVANALHFMAADLECMNSSAFDNDIDEYRAFSFWFCETLQKVLKSYSKDAFYIHEDECSFFIRFLINYVDFGSQSFFDVVWGKIGKQNVQENNSDNKEILARLDRIEALLLELRNRK